MTSKAAKRRTHKQTRRAIPATPRPAATTTLRLVDTKPRTKTGIEWMVGKKRLTSRQAQAGARYGLKFRLSEVDGMQPLRSCLNDEPRGGAGVMALTRAASEDAARRDLLSARSALGFHSAMISACDLICGRGLTPWEAIDLSGGNQRDVERIQNTLSIALDLLATHYSLTK